MASTYDFKAIEAKWQGRWEDSRLFEAAPPASARPKFYALIEFPYPSGAGLHVGHQRPFTAMDIVARKRRMQGYNVLYPIGFDSFGLPTENYAILTGVRPEVATRGNVDNFVGQLKATGFSFDWSRAVMTSDPRYYKWTQFMFVRLFKAGLAYKEEEEIWWCPKCRIGIANEELEAGRCERCGAEVERKTKPIWTLRMQSYSDKLLEGLDRVDYPEPVKKMQRDWIGKSVGAEVDFALSNGGALKVFTTRPDTIDGVCFMVCSPEVASSMADACENAAEIRAYCAAALAKSDVERQQDARAKTGVPMKGLSAANPYNNESVPVFVADYVLGRYGTGAIMGVPDLDERDAEFAAAFGIKVKKTKLLSPAASAKVGKRCVNYKMTDWQFSRQRYWGEPIPMVYCEKCGWVPLPESELPLVLPHTDDYLPTDEGLSPLAKLDDWVKTKCPECGAPAVRETDTMPQWAGSCWYFLRYMDPHNDREFASKEALDYWGQVDWYQGGPEHVTRHMLYSRFWHKALFDAGLVPHDEPYAKRTQHDMILAEGGVKMSKSKGNVVNPNDIISEYGADTLRVYIMFIGPFDQAVAWSTASLVGVHRFLTRVHGFLARAAEAEMSRADRSALAVAVRDVGERIEGMKFNTAVAALMILANYIDGLAAVPRDLLRTFAKLLSPFAPHLADEMWEALGGKGSLALEPWPDYDPADLAADTIAVVVQVNGKKRAEFAAPAGASDDELKSQALPLAEKYFDGRTPKKAIVVRGRLVNFVV